MIIVAIVALSGVVLLSLYGVLVGFPALPPAVTQYAALLIGYIDTGCKIFYQFVYADVVKALLGFTLAITVIWHGYKFVMWLAKKIPMFGVSD